MQSKMSYGNSMLLITPSLYNSCTNLRYDCELVWHISNAGNCQQAILPDRRPGDVTRVRGQSVWKVKQTHLWEVQDERTAALGTSPAQGYPVQVNTQQPLQQVSKHADEKLLLPEASRCFVGVPSPFISPCFPEKRKVSPPSEQLCTTGDTVQMQGLPKQRS